MEILYSIILCFCGVILIVMCVLAIAICKLLYWYSNDD